MTDTMIAAARSLAREARELPRQRAAVRETLDAIAGQLDAAADAIAAGNVPGLIEIVYSKATGGEGSLMLRADGLKYGRHGRRNKAQRLGLSVASWITHGGPDAMITRYYEGRPVVGY